ncbi:hypothetical protein ACRALDRAFT_2096768 [Sodiomyces alcalophilus JCM 7366]|uniref:uncharacterized protein n=1 Tax=Sodiomyces alcalophilus JCM 7366 TaxID=591952 RepID=UPI0039B5D9E3
MTEEDTPAFRPVRYCFKVPVEQIPGPALGRSITLANDFMLPRFNRKFDWKHDYIYTPVNIEKSGHMWLLLDVGKDAYPQASSDNVDLAVFKVRSIDGVLNYEEASYYGIRKYTSTFPWGGR